MSQSPSLSPTHVPTPWGGLEQLGILEVVLANASDIWASGYPSRPLDNLLEPGSEYYIHNSNPDININFDLEHDHLIESVYVKSWYITRIAELQACTHADDGQALPMSETVMVPDANSPGWTCETYTPITGGYNLNKYAYFSNVTARYVQIVLRGGYSGYANRWGLRQIAIRGSV